MKLLALLMLCAVATAAPKVEKEQLDLSQVLAMDDPFNPSPEARNILINALIRQLFTYIRFVINNGSSLFGVPPLDPLVLDQFNLSVPAGFINLDLDLEDILATGIGGFVVHTSNLNLRGDLTFELDISVPKIDIRAGKYDLLGDLFTAIPLYGKGDATFILENFRFQAMLYLKQSDDGRSILIDRIEGVDFQIPHFKSELTGAIGGGDIDAIVNAVIEDVIIGYVNRFRGAISIVVSRGLVTVMNPVLDQLDTWRYIAPFV